MTAERIVWVDVRANPSPEILAMLDPAMPLNAALMPARMIDALPRVRFTHTAAYVESSDEVAALPRDAIVVAADDEALRVARARGFATGWYARIDDESTMRQACAQIGVHDFLIADLADATNIPLELLVAIAQRTSTKVLKRIRDVSDARVASGVLEIGCDGVVVAPEVFRQAEALAVWQRSASTEAVTLRAALVSEVQAIGLGDRVCVDTVEMLEKDDGMVVGSTARGGLVVCAEVHPLPYMKLRPFRVNAGSVHSYAACPADRTAYLSELAAGDSVLVTSSSGIGRTVVVGRAKTERRPLLKLSAEYEDAAVNAIVQNDWHVRVFDGGGSVRSVTEIRRGDRVLVGLRSGGRHVGHSIGERLWES